MRIQSETEIGGRQHFPFSHGNVLQGRRTAWSRGSAILSLAVVAVMFMPALARADCSTMLAPLFNPPPNSHVYATITNQTAQNWKDGWWTANSFVDPVSYAEAGKNGFLALGSMWWPTGGQFWYTALTYSGTLELRSNNTMPPFSLPQNTLKLAINTNGQLNIQMPGKTITGLGSCNNGLVTILDPANPSSQWTLSFTTLNPAAPDPSNDGIKR